MRGLDADHRPQARNDLVVLCTALVAVGRLADDSSAWIVGILIAATAGLGSLRAFRAFGEARPVRWPIESAVTPAVAAVAGFGALRLVPLGIGLVPGILAAGALIWVALDLESRVLARAGGATSADRTAIRAIGLLCAFLSFAGIAGLVPGGLVEPAASEGAAQATGTPLSEGSLLVLGVADASIALLLGYRFAALHVGHLRPAMTAALGYGASIAIAAGLVRAAALPRLLGPAILTLVLFLWDAVRGASPASRRDPRFVWQVALLAVVGLVVVAWNVGLRR